MVLETFQHAGVTHFCSRRLPVNHHRPGAVGSQRRSLRCTAQKLSRDTSQELHSTPNISTTRRTALMLGPAACACSLCSTAAAAKAAAGRNPSMDKLFAKAMATGMDEYEEKIIPVKTRLFEELNAHLEKTSAASGGPALVVEIGMGTGPNLKYYSPKNTKIIAVDPNSFMQPFMKENMESLGWEESAVVWTQGVAENLPLEDASVDAVVCTLVLCSVGDVQTAVQEVRRVLRPGGKFLFIEHTAAPPQSGLLLRVGQTVLDPLQRWLADGCSLLRDPLPVIENAGMDATGAMRFEVEGMGLIAPHVAGMATV